MAHEAARLATRADVARLAELATQGEAELAGQRGGGVRALREARPGPYELALGELVAAPDALVVVGTFDDVIVGFASVRLEPLRDGTSLGVIDDLYVEPEARGVGVGEAMMDAIITWAEGQGARGLDSVALPGNRATKNFFERFGLTARAILVHRPLGAWAAEDDAAS